MDFLKIGSTVLPSPVKYEISNKDVNGEESMSETGVLHRNRVRSGVYSLDLVWRVSEADLKKILNLISDISFTAVFSDPVSAEEKSCVMYAGEKIYSCIGFDEGQSWWNLSVKLKEL